MTNVQYASTAYLDLATHFNLLLAKHQKKHITRRVIKANNESSIHAKEIKAKGSTANKTCRTNTLPTQAQKRLFKKKQKEQNCVGITGTATPLKKKKRNIDWPDIAGKSRAPLDGLISILEHGSLSRTPLFASQSSEEQCVKYQLT
jgi:hypothetical protein